MRRGTASEKERLAGLEGVLGYTFRDRAILQQALVHASYLHEHPALSLASNERLEFLGDAFLDFVVADELYRRLPDQPEGILTKLRSGVVQRESLAKAAAELGLGQFLKLARGEEQVGGRTRPSMLADAYEAILGAVLVDGGEGPARDFVVRTLQGLLDSAVAGSLHYDCKSQLQEHCQAQKWEAPAYRVTGEEGQPHNRRFFVEVLINGHVRGSGSGTSKQNAEKEAAREALAHLLHEEALVP